MSEPAKLSIPILISSQFMHKFISLKIDYHPVFEMLPTLQQKYFSKYQC